MAISERPGEGLRGAVGDREVRITSRKWLAAIDPGSVAILPPEAGGLECIVLLDGRYSASILFRDEPRHEGAEFIRHFGPRHRFDRLMLLSGDRESEVRYLADRVGVAGRSTWAWRRTAAASVACSATCGVSRRS